MRGPVHTGFACPPPSALRVWLPSRRLSPLHVLPAMFHTGSAFGILPSELSPLARLQRRYPPLRAPLAVTHAPRIAAPKRDHAVSTQLGYRVLPFESPSRPRRVFSPAHRWLLPWAFSLSGDLIVNLGRHFGPPPPTRLCATSGYPWPRRMRHGVSIG